MRINYRKKLLSLYFKLQSYRKKSQWKGEQPIFCISMQKTGTTSIGDFFEYFGYPVVRSDVAHLRNWNQYWYEGNSEQIFKDPVFKNHQVFEDAPFWAKDFHQILYHKFPKAHFILFTRDANAWFESLVHHGQNDILGDKRFHAVNYDQAKAIEDVNYKIQEHRSHYTQFYTRRNQEIIDFFTSNSAHFFHTTLEDPQKWEKLAQFMELEIPQGFEIHANAKS